MTLHNLGVSVLVIAAVGTTLASASPVNYTIDFTTVPGSLALTTGSFTYDSAVQSFTNFSVDSEGLSFDFTSVANQGSGTCQGTQGAKGVFDFLMGTCGPRTWDIDIYEPDYFEMTNSSNGTIGRTIWLTATNGQTLNSSVSTGDFVVIPQVSSTVPEPSAVMLFFSALLLIVTYLERKRIPTDSAGTILATDNEKHEGPVLI